MEEVREGMVKEKDQVSDNRGGPEKFSISCPRQGEWVSVESTKFREVREGENWDWTLSLVVQKDPDQLLKEKLQERRSWVTCG